MRRFVTNAPNFFEENRQIKRLLKLLKIRYTKYLDGIQPERTHNGYFSIDKKSKRLVDPTVAARGETAGQTDDDDAYDVILKDKERLLFF